MSVFRIILTITIGLLLSILTIAGYISFGISLLRWLILALISCLVLLPVLFAKSLKTEKPKNKS
jgi:hypothetical protein